MPPHSLLAVTNSFWSPKRIRAAYHQASSSEAVELPMIAPLSNTSTTTDVQNPTNGPQLGSQDEGSPCLEKPNSTLLSFRQRFVGWRCSVLSFAICASIVFLVNLTVTIVGHLFYNTTQGTLKKGDCQDIKNLNRALHILINIFSTILLSGSSYCMQCLSAPTREEVNQAHARNEWLDIGIPSVRNLTHISGKRLFLWMLLGLSSLPLHLLYNSVVYPVLSSNDYDAFVVNENFNRTECNHCDQTSIIYNLWNQSRNRTLEKLDANTCRTAYTTYIQSSRRNLLLVTDRERPNNSHPPFEFNNADVYIRYQFLPHLDETRIVTGLPPFQWIYSGVVAEDSWSVGTYCEPPTSEKCKETQWPVKYCLSEPGPPYCKLNYGTEIAIIVTCLNFFKAALMFYVLYSVKDDPIMTMGDAVSSFLQNEDTKTKDRSLSSFQNFREGYSSGAKVWENAQLLWKDATSRTRRATTLVMFFIALTFIGYYLVLAVSQLREQSAKITELAFGAADARTLVVSTFLPTGAQKLALVANIPQLILSIVYFSYNGLLTAMLMGHEWISYAHKRKGLRVSRKPTGMQRSTYFLQLPYKFGIPLSVFSVVLHWLVSQSVFVVAIDEYTSKGEPSVPDYDFSEERGRRLGFSPMPMVAVLIVGGVMACSVIGFGFIPYKRGMPLAGSCSMAISAACHPRKTDEFGSESRDWEQKLQWGVVETNAEGVGHCAFSTRDVEPLVQGRFYE